MKVEIRVHSGAVRAYLTLLESSGEAISPLTHPLGLAGMSEIVVGQPDSMVSYSQWRALLKSVSAPDRDPFLHLRAGSGFAVGTFGALQYLIQSRGTLGEALKDFVQLGDRLSDYARYSLAEVGDHILFKKVLNISSREVSPDAADFCFSAIVANFRRVLGFRWSPHAIHLRRARVSSAVGYENAFGCPVEFGCEEDQIIFHKADARRPLLTQNPELTVVLENFLVKAGARNEVRFSFEVRRALERDAGHFRSDIVLVAKNLSLSPRSLQRRLADEGTSFQELSDRVRKELALHCLRHEKNLSIKALADRLGYSNPRSLTRAFIRWFGVPPAVLRQKGGA